MLFPAVNISELFRKVRYDFDLLRRDCGPIRTQLIHVATNAEAEGVKGMPIGGSHIAAFGSAGNRDFIQCRNEDGSPRFRTDPIVDVKGQPITNSAGQAFDVLMPAHRSIAFSGQVEDYHKLEGLAVRAGRLLSLANNALIDKLIETWRFSSYDDLWWAVLFELAWSNTHPLLYAKKQIWLEPGNTISYLPYDIEQLKQLRESRIGSLKAVPENWTKRLPDAFSSEIANIVDGSFDCADYFLSILSPAEQPSLQNEVCPENEPESDDKKDQKMNIDHNIRRRFSVALSFAGEQRELVEQIALMLEPCYGQHRLFYDRFHQAELSQSNLDLLLQRIYKDESELLVVFLSKEYEKKDWCGIEWRVVRDIIKNRNRDNSGVMYVSIDGTQIEGMLSIDGYLDTKINSARQIADNIMRRRNSIS